MPLSRNLGAYQDVKVILDAVLARGGGEYELPTKGAATHWRQRAYKYRSLLYGLKAAEYATMPGLMPSTPYDHMVLRAHPDKPNVVQIEFLKPTGFLRDAAGEAVEVEEAGADDALLADAEELIRTLG